MIPSIIKYIFILQCSSKVYVSKISCIHKEINHYMNNMTKSFLRLSYYCEAFFSMIFLKISKKKFKLISNKPHDSKTS